MWRTGVLLVITLGAVAAPAAAEPMVGIVGGDALITFDSTSPGVVGSVHAINGLVAGPNERVVGIDFRGHALPGIADPAAAQKLFAVTAVDGGGTDAVRLYTIDPGNGNATLVSAAPVTLTHGDAYGVDFNPGVDRLRVVNDGDENARLNPNNGARVDGTDTDLNPANRGVTAVAYEPDDGDSATGVTLYGLATTPSSLVMIGGVKGVPSANGGVLNTIGPLGQGTFAGAQTANFDISPTGAAYATTRTSALTVPFLSSVNLATGALTPIGRTATALEGLAVVPPSTVSFGVAGATVSEGAGTATLSVVRGGVTSGTTRVEYSASDGSAAGSLLFEAGETVKSFSVPVADNTLDGPDRTVTLALRATDALTTIGGNAVLTIADDDPAPDTTAPTLTISAPKSVKLAAFLKGVKVTVTPNEAAALEITLEGTVTNARISAYNVALAKKTLASAAGARSVTLKPAKKVVGKPRRTAKVRVRVLATDAAGNRSTATRTISVKPR